jgi:hypothetical protein
MRKIAWSSVLLLLIAATVAGQDKPDFSGRWVLENPADSASDIARSLTVRQSIVRTTARGAPMEPFFRDLMVEREFSTRARSESYQIGVVGGVVYGVDRTGRGAGPEGQNRETRFAVRWDENRLVIETGTYSGPTRESGPNTEHTEGVVARRREQTDHDRHGPTLWDRVTNAHAHVPKAVSGSTWQPVCELCVDFTCAAAPRNQVAATMPLQPTSGWRMNLAGDDGERRSRLSGNALTGSVSDGPSSNQVGGWCARQPRRRCRVLVLYKQPCTGTARLAIVGAGTGLFVACRSQGVFESDRSFGPRRCRTRCPILSAASRTIGWRQ